MHTLGQAGDWWLLLQYVGVVGVCCSPDGLLHCAVCTDCTLSSLMIPEIQHKTDQGIVVMLHQGVTASDAGSLRTTVSVALGLVPSVNMQDQCSCARSLVGELSRQKTKHAHLDPLEVELRSMLGAACSAAALV